MTYFSFLPSFCQTQGQGLSLSCCLPPHRSTHNAAPLLRHLSTRISQHVHPSPPNTQNTGAPSPQTRRIDSPPSMLPSTHRDTHPAVAAALAYVEQHCKGVDASHDLSHILRVLALTDRIARAEGLPSESLQTAWLCAALHDVGDAKYVKDGADVLKQALDSLAAAGHVTTAQIEHIQAVVSRMSFREELPGGLYTPEDLLRYPELGPLKDADQLDAIGAIGIARTFAFGGARGRAFYDMEVLAAERARAGSSTTTSSTSSNSTTVLPTSKEAYASTASSETGKAHGKAEDTLAHFHEKLLHLAGRMKTKEGQALAKARHAYMEEFVAQFVGEVWGER